MDDDELDLLRPQLPMSCDLRVEAERAPDDRLAKALRILANSSAEQGAAEPAAEGRSAGPSLLRHILTDLRKRPVVIVPAAGTHWNLGCLDFANFAETMASPICPMSEGDGAGTEERITASLSIRGASTKILVIPMTQVVKLKDQDWEAVVSICLTGADWEWSQISGAFVDGRLRNNVKLWFFKTPEKPVPAFLQSRQGVVTVANCSVHTSYASDFWTALRELLNARYEPDDNMDM